MGIAELSELTTRALANGCALSCDAAAFAIHVEMSQPVPEFLDDLLLAFAAAQGDPEATRQFELKYADLFRSTTVRILGASDADDMVQVLRERLFVGDNGREPRLAEYRGQAPLSSWLRTLCTRACLNAKRDREGKRERELDSRAEPLIFADVDPIAAQVLRRYGAAFKASFERALGELSPQLRNVMRMNVVDGLNIEAIGRIYGVHRATVARWISLARETLSVRTAELLGAEAQLTQTEFMSIARLCQSQIHLSIARVLQDEESSTE